MKNTNTFYHSNYLVKNILKKKKQNLHIIHFSIILICCEFIFIFLKLLLLSLLRDVLCI